MLDVCVICGVVLRNMPSLVGTTLVITAVFLLYYSVYGLLLLLSTDCPKDVKTKAAFSIGMAFLLAVGLYIGSSKVGEAWHHVEEQFESSPMYSTDRFANAEASRYWVQRTMTTTVAAAVLFPIVFVWMKSRTLAPLENTCTLRTGTIWAQARDSLKSLEFLVYGVALMLAASLYSSIKNWRAFRAEDKASEKKFKQEEREDALQAARERRLERFGDLQQQQQHYHHRQYDDDGDDVDSNNVWEGDTTPQDYLYRSIKKAAPLATAGAAVVAQAAARAGRKIHGAFKGNKTDDPTAPFHEVMLTEVVHEAPHGEGGGRRATLPSSPLPSPSSSSTSPASSSTSPASTTSSASSSPSLSKTSRGFSTKPRAGLPHAVNRARGPSSITPTRGRAAVKKLKIKTKRKMK